MNPLKNIDTFHTNLLRWYDLHGRKDLPWRNARDPYHILVSEMMLQQTQVGTVLKRFYQPFLNRFPTLASLKKASRDDVMQAWQGLGYYRRAGFLHEIAQQVAPTLPNNYDALIALPGIGKNTAHALLAFAHHQPYAVMEANVKRVISRIFALHNPKEVDLWNKAKTLLNKHNPFDHNQAMMDLGAMTCIIKQPKCNVCPANQICAGKKHPECYPATIRKKSPPIRYKNILVIHDMQDRIYASVRNGAMLGGLYQFIELDKYTDVLRINGIDYPKDKWKPLGKTVQKYSHFSLHADIFSLCYPGSHGEKYWHTRQELNLLPISKLEQAILKLA